MITRNNYEEFFLLYVDHELSASERNAVEAFIRQNPDLGVELSMLQQSIALPDEAVRYADKEGLLRHPLASGLIHPDNREEYFLLYIDQELDPSTRMAVEKMLELSPDYQKELLLLQQAKMVPDPSILFREKEKLYRREEKKMPFWIQSMSAAAVGILLIAGFWLYRATEGPNAPAKGLAAQPLPGSSKTSAAGVNRKILSPVTPSPADAYQVLAARKGSTQMKVLPAISSVNGTKEKKDQAIPKSESGLAISKPHEESQTREPRVVTAENGRIEPGSHTAGVEPLSTEASLAASNKDNQAEAREEGTQSQYSGNRFASSDNNVEYIDVTNSPAKKNKLRGIFRRVSRVFEKTTNADDADKRSVAIGSFQIAIR